MSPRRQRAAGREPERRRDLPPVRNLKLRRGELLQSEAKDDVYDFIEEYDANGRHLRLERLPR